MATEPTTIQEAVIYFADADNCREYLVARRWPNGIVCPRCGVSKVVFLARYNRWQCSSTHDGRQFTAKTGTMMEDSPIGLDKWMVAVWLMANCRQGSSSCELRQAIGVAQRTAWFLHHRIGLALRGVPRGKLAPRDTETGAV
jgi:transposase-like protein